ncbi:MAG: hypothetical protein ACRD0U_05780 [Acidimicrobiales bacterium]
MNAHQSAGRRARSQHGVLAHGQALRAGLTQEEIEGKTGRGEWLHPVRGVYIMAGAPVTWRQEAMVALLAGGPKAVVSHLTAAAVLDFWQHPPRVPHIIVPPGSSPRSPVATVHRSALGPSDRLMVGGIATTSATRTLIDAAAVLNRRELEDLVDDVFCRQLSCTVAVGSAVERLGRRGRRGLLLLEEVIDVWTPGIQPGSPAEMRLLRRLADWGYSPPERQVDVVSADGRFIGRADLGWVSERVGFEYDSDRRHNPRYWVRDEARDAGYEAAGWRILPVGKRDLMPSSDLRERIDRAFRQQAA